MTGDRPTLLDGTEHGDAVFSETGDRVVALTADRARLLRDAAERSRRLVLVTGEGAALTLPLRDALLATGGVWVVREGARGGRDAVTGRRLASVLDATDPSGPPGPETTSPAFLGAAPDGAAPDRPAPDVADAEPPGEIGRRQAAPSACLVTLSLSVRHSARPTTVLGRAAELAVETLTGAPPVAWGPHEPASRPWDRGALTAVARDRAPDLTLLVVAGDGVVGTVHVRRTSDGLEESTTLELAAGPPGSAAAHAVLDRVPGLFDALAEEAIPLFFLATTRTGRADLLVPPRAQAAPEPLTMLLGPPGVRQLDVDLGEAARRFDAVRVGRRRLPALRFPLGTPDGAGWGTTSRIARWLGVASDGA
ncbi:DUF6177 family protein [Promicromonospora sp. NPDC057488]|uniref:DUF6177 family protein n=1 Tax=Promicromonospora sp. NPDC057488 TaxID=3346147 RepID=UPI00366C0DDE